MSRRGENIYRRSDGRWEARYIHHYEDGRPKYRYLYGKSYNEVKQKKLSEQTTGRKTTTRTCENILDFDGLSDRWLASIRTQVKESTYTQYSRIISVYLKPAFKTMLFSDCPDKLPEYLLESGGARGGALSPKTVTDILCVWKSVLKYGQQHGFSGYEKLEIRYPQKTPKRICILDDVGRKQLEDVILSSGSVESLGILIALFTGLRIGELCGLKWEDVDLRNRTICICRTVERIPDLDAAAEKKTKVIVGAPKTASSERIIPLPRFLAERLLQFFQSSRDGVQPGSYVLSGTGEPVEPHCFYVRYQKFLKKHGFPGMTFHVLRHTFATRCVELGFDVKTLSEILGHSNINTTLSVYVHPTLKQKRVQMERLVPESHS